MRRWEVERGMPVYRVPGAARGSVFAYAEELTRWLQGAVAVGDPPAASAASATQEPEKEVHPSPVVTFPSAPTATAPASEPVAAISVPAQLVPAPALSSAQAPLRTPRSVLSRSLFWSLLAVLLAATFLVISFRHRIPRFQTLAAWRQPNDAPRDSRLGPDSVAVLPFINVQGNDNTDYISDGITESLIANLAHLPQLRVRSRDSVFRYKGSDASLRTIAKELGVSAVVTGRVTLQGENIDITAELTNLRNDRQIWSNHYSGSTANLIALQRQIAGDIAGKLRSTLSSADRERAISQGTEDAEAYSLYLKGRYAFFNRSYVRLQSAISLFNQAIAKDPQYALAYSGLADVYSVLPTFGGNPSEDYPKSNAAARRALELDPNLPHPHAILGSNEMGYDWDFTGGEAEFKRALELDPNDATAHQWYAERLGDMGGREQEAWAEINLAHQLDPQSFVIRRVIGSVLVAARRYDEGIAVCKQLEADDPSYTLAHDCLAQAYWAKRMYPQMVEEWKLYGHITGNRDDAEFGDALERGFRSGGWKGALSEAARIREDRRKTGYSSPYQIARFHADLGDKEKAFEWLDIAYREHDWLLMDLNTAAQFDALRSDPRFEELVKKVGIPIASASH